MKPVNRKFLIVPISLSIVTAASALAVLRPAERERHLRCWENDYIAGQTALRAGRAKYARERLVCAQEELKQIDRRPQLEALTLISLGAACSALGEQSQVLKYQTEAIAICQRALANSTDGAERRKWTLILEKCQPRLTTGLVSAEKESSGQHISSGAPGTGAAGESPAHHQWVSVTDSSNANKAVHSDAEITRLKAQLRKQDVTDGRQSYSAIVTCDKLAKLLCRSGKYAESQQYSSRAERYFSSNEDEYYDKLNRLLPYVYVASYKQNNYIECQRVLDKQWKMLCDHGLENGGSAKMILHAKATNLSKLSRFAEARAAADRLVKLCGNDEFRNDREYCEAFIELAEVELAAGRPDLASNAFEKACAVWQGHHDALAIRVLYYLGQSRQREHKYAAAATAFKLAAELVPGSTEPCAQKAAEDYASVCKLGNDATGQSVSSKPARGRVR